jgi:hypothetical protein
MPSIDIQCKQGPACTEIEADPDKVQRDTLAQARGLLIVQNQHTSLNHVSSPVGIPRFNAI